MNARRSWMPTELLVRYLDGELSLDDGNAVERAARDSGEVRARLERLRRIRRALESPVPELEQRDLAAAVHRGIEARSRQSPHAWAAALSLAAAVVCGLWIVGRPADSALLALAQTPTDNGEFRAKTAAQPTSKSAVESARDRWLGLQVHRVHENGAPERVSDRVAVGDGLVFSYTNLGPDPFHYFAIVGNNGGDWHWFFPDVTASRNETSMRAVEGQAEVPLAELIHPQLQVGSLKLAAVFSRRPLAAREMEAWLASYPASNTVGPGGAVVTWRTLEVVSTAPDAPTPNTPGTEPRGAP
jgi:hypothetical protein